MPFGHEADVFKFGAQLARYAKHALSRSDFSIQIQRVIAMLSLYLLQGRYLKNKLKMFASQLRQR